MLRAFLVLLATICVAWGQDNVLTWERLVIGEKVRETAYIFERSGEIMMESKDYRLKNVEKQNILPSVSLHDYSATRPDELDNTASGLTALKTRLQGKRGYRDVCIVTVPTNDFDKTYKILQARQGTTVEEVWRPKRLTMNEKAFIDLKSHSQSLASFCKDVDVFLAELTDPVNDELPQAYRWWPWLLCIYYPYELIVPWWLWVWYL